MQVACVLPLSLPLLFAATAYRQNWLYPAFIFFFNDPAPPEIYPLSLHDALPICHEYIRKTYLASCRGRTLDGPDTGDADGPLSSRLRLRRRSSASHTNDRSGTILRTGRGQPLPGADHSLVLGRMGRSAVGVGLGIPGGCRQEATLGFAVFDSGSHGAAASAVLVEATQSGPATGAREFGDTSRPQNAFRLSVGVFGGFHIAVRK